MAVPHSFDSTYRAIRRGTLVPVYYLTGPEEVLKRELVDLLVDRATDGTTRDFNLDSRSAADLDAESFTTLVETPPMLAERRVVVIRDIDRWRKNSKARQALVRYLSNPSPTTLLVLTQSAGSDTHADLVRLAHHVEVEGLDPERLSRWVKRQAERVGAVLAPEAIRHLVDAVGTDLSLLGMELNKLAAAGLGETIDAQDVAALVGVRRGETAHDWSTAVIERDVPRALGMLPTVLGSAGVTGVRLLMLLGSRLVGTRLARTLLDGGTAPGRLPGALLQYIRTARARYLGDWKAEAAAWASAARRWSPEELDAAICAAHDADRALKSTTIADELDILADLVVRLSYREAAA
jgi:DNA polymerase-3 subunit delta